MEGAACQRGMEGERLGGRVWGGGEGTEQPGLPVIFGTEACCARIISTAVTPFWSSTARCIMEEQKKKKRFRRRRRSGGGRGGQLPVSMCPR